MPFVLFFEGLSRATSAQAAFLHKTLLVWVAVLAVVFLGERLQRAALAGDRAPRRRTDRADRAGVGGFGTPEAMILAATLLWSVEVVVAKRLLGEGVVVDGRRRPDGPRLGGPAGWVAVRGDLALLTSMTAEQVGWVLLTGVLLAGVRRHVVRRPPAGAGRRRHRGAGARRPGDRGAERGGRRGTARAAAGLAGRARGRRRARRVAGAGAAAPGRCAAGA